MRIAGPLLALALLASADLASGRDLAVPAGTGWQHAITGLILPAAIDGNPRTALQDLGAGEFDIVASFDSDDRAITTYLFRPGLDGVALWFDRIDSVVRLRGPYGTPLPLTASPVAFARPGGLVLDALRLAYTVGKAPWTSTAAAVMPLGDWLVAVRLSSKSDDAASLDARLTRLLPQIRFPADAKAGPAVEPIQPCTTSLQYRRAKLLRPDGAATLLGAVMGSMPAAKEDKPSAEPPERLRFCRDGEAKLAYSVYRTDDKRRRYWLGLSDAGRAVHVSGEVGALLGDKAGFQVSLLDLTSRSIYRSFDRLPQPEQAFDLVNRERPLSSSDGSTITLPETFK